MKILFFSLLVFITSAAFAQDPDKTVTLKASGSGTTQEQAKNNALRSAVEQAYGAFISSKTEILNDQIVADEIVSVASGNIQAFKILEEQHTDSLDFCLLEAVVSISKLTSFAQSKGYAVEVQGGMFAINIKQKQLNETAEIQAIRNALSTAQELMMRGFNYTLQTKEPIVNDAIKGDWKINTDVWSATNDNYQKAEEIIESTLKNISLKPNELNEYKSLGKRIYTVKYHPFLSSEITEYNLRTSDALWAIIRLTFKIPTFTQLYVISDGIKPDTYGIEADCQKKSTLTYPRPQFNEMINQYVRYNGINGKFYNGSYNYLMNYSQRDPLSKTLYEWDNYAQFLPELHVNILDYYEFKSNRVLTQSNLNLIYTTDEIQKLNNITCKPVTNVNVTKKISSDLKPDLTMTKAKEDQICDYTKYGATSERSAPFMAKIPIPCCCIINNAVILKHFEDNWKKWHQNIINKTNTQVAYETKMRPGIYCFQIIYITEVDGSASAFIFPGKKDGISLGWERYTDPTQHNEAYNRIDKLCFSIQEQGSFGNQKINQTEYKIISQFLYEESKNISNYPISIFSIQRDSETEKFEMKAREVHTEYLFIHVN